MMDMPLPSSSRDPHEPYVREALAHLRGHPGAGLPARDHEGSEAEHHFALPTIEPVGAVRPPESSDW
jgi:hypothetical protein